ncbi:MAG: RNA polymerase sigma-70 factor [Bacteroidota bacterium]
MLFGNKSTPSTPDFKTAEGFEKVYRIYVAKLCRIAYNQLNDQDASKNIVQGVFTTLWERRNNLDIKGPVENYLVRAVKLAVMDALRSQSLRRDRLDDFLADYCGSTQCTEQQVAFNELSSKVDHLTDQLPCQCKKVYDLSRNKGMKNKEIASVLLISEKAVEAHLTKALKFLRNNLPEYQEQ